MGRKLLSKIKRKIAGPGEAGKYQLDIFYYLYDSYKLCPITFPALTDYLTSTYPNVHPTKYPVQNVLGRQIRMIPRTGQTGKPLYLSNINNKEVSGSY